MHIVLRLQLVFVSAGLCVCWSMCLFAYVSVCLCAFVSVGLCAYLHVCLFLCWSFCLCVFLSLCLCVFVSVFLCVRVSVCLCVCLSVCLFVYWSVSVLPPETLDQSEPSLHRRKAAGPVPTSPRCGAQQVTLAMNTFMNITMLVTIVKHSVLLYGGNLGVLPAQLFWILPHRFHHHSQGVPECCGCCSRVCNVWLKSWTRTR